MWLNLARQPALAFRGGLGFAYGQVNVYCHTSLFPPFGLATWFDDWDVNFQPIASETGKNQVLLVLGTGHDQRGLLSCPEMKAK
jgi:hypothetical protein